MFLDLGHAEVFEIQTHFSLDKLSNGSISKAASIEVGSRGGEKTDLDISLRADLGK